MQWLSKNVSETQIKLRDRLWLYVFSAVVLFLLIVPSLVVIPMSFSASQYLEFPPKEWLKTGSMTGWQRLGRR